IWERMAALNLNTLLAPVSWELIEPQEGTFDFTLVDGLLRASRSHGLRLILLWFGSWKNGMSSYAPLWVKRDTTRFPRTRLGDKTAEVLSTARALVIGPWSLILRYCRRAEIEVAHVVQRAAAALGPLGVADAAAVLDHVDVERVDRLGRQ